MGTAPRLAAVCLLALAAIPAAGDGNGVSLWIAAPAADSVIHDNQGQLDVTVTVSPALDADAGDRVQLLVDGVPAGRSASGQFRVTALSRGSHVIAAELVDKEGRPLYRSPPVTVHLWQASRLMPQPSRPAGAPGF